MLAAISQVLNECTKPDQASPAALVLQGLQALCEAEVRIWLAVVFCSVCGSWTFFLVGFCFKSTLDCGRLIFFYYFFSFFLTNLIPLFQDQYIFSWETVL